MTTSNFEPEACFRRGWKNLQEIDKVMIPIAVPAGFPTVLNAAFSAEDVLAERDPDGIRNPD